MSVKITDYLDLCIENFAIHVDNGEGWIAKDDVLRQFTTRYPDFEKPIFDKEELKKYIIDDLKNWYGVEVRD